MGTYERGDETVYLRRIMFWVTFFSFMSLHAARKAITNAKLELNSIWFMPADYLGVLDTLFMLCYASGLFMSGYLADKYHPKLVLICGLCGTSVCFFIMGFVHFWGGRELWFFALMMMINGFCQSAGWPTCVAIMTNWFSKESRGVAFGLWAANPSLGNVVGSWMVSLCVGLNWSVSMMFALPAAFLFCMALFDLFVLTAHPNELGLPSVDSTPVGPDSDDDDDAEAARGTPNGDDDLGYSYEGAQEEALGILPAIQIPGVIQYSLSNASTKMVNYGIFFWLPYYLHEHRGYSDESSDMISSLYDWGQIVGGIVIGLLADRIGHKAFVAIAFLFVSTIPLYFLSMSLPYVFLIVILLLAGALSGGPGILIGATISSDLGSSCVSSKALSTVIGIVDGVGSLGASCAQWILGFLVQGNDWNAVFYLLIFLQIAAAVPLLPYAIKSFPNDWSTLLYKLVPWLANATSKYDKLPSSSGTATDDNDDFIDTMENPYDYDSDDEKANKIGRDRRYNAGAADFASGDPPYVSDGECDM